MTTISSAKIFIINKVFETQPNSNKLPALKQVEQWLIEFAKMHVTEALKQASKKATAFQLCNETDPIIISENSILTSYDLGNVE